MSSEDEFCMSSLETAFRVESRPTLSLRIPGSGLGFIIVFFASQVHSNRATDFHNLIPEKRRGSVELK
jgi:hypothetical protein